MAKSRGESARLGKLKHAPLWDRFPHPGGRSPRIPSYEVGEAGVGAGAGAGVLGPGPGSARLYVWHHGGGVVRVGRPRLLSEAWHAEGAELLPHASGRHRLYHHADRKSTRLN